MATDYLTIGHAESGGSITDGKKFEVLSVETGVKTPFEIDEGTLDGASSISIGTPKRIWKIKALVYFTEIKSGYATYADIMAMYLDSAVATNVYKLHGMDTTTVYDVVIENRGGVTMKSLSALPYETDSLYEADLEFRQV